MFFGIYGRKSVYSDKSDSVDNQHRMCNDYIKTHFKADDITLITSYSDEDYTGANTKRPDLQRLLEDVKSSAINVLVVYQLDRISRDVRDFSNIYAMLEEYHVMFISIKENIDTTTPIGRAMMYVTVVFAQMERETIATRVRDNMIGLAKKGFWTGGNPPYGYVRKNILINGKKHVTIEPDPDGVAYNIWIYDSFLKNHCSLQSMETNFRKEGIKTRNGAFFSTTQLYKILTMPYCVEATPEIYDYFAAKGCQMDPDSPREKWDGSVGVMIYGRSTGVNKKHQLQPPEKWLVCLGLHKPFMPAAKWLAVQNQFSENKFDKTQKYDIPLLKGILRCSCGSIMAVSRKKKINGEVSSWYYCLRRMKNGVEACDRKQIKVDIIDQKLLNTLHSIEIDPSMIYRFVQKSELPLPDIKTINNKISSIESRIGRLASSLALADGSAASKYIVAEIERLDSDLQFLKRERAVINVEIKKRDELNESAEGKAQHIQNVMKGLNGFTAEEKNRIMRDILKECVWDGSELSIVL